MAIDTRPLADPQIVFPGASVMAGMCRSFEWEKTSLGPPSEWSSALRITVAIVLESPFPMNLWSGPDLNLIYNDAYRAVLGAKHARALGRPGREVWGEIWPQISPLFDQIRAGGPATYVEDAHFLMERSEGPPGEAWFTFSLSPVRDEDGTTVAFLNVAAETTERVLAEHTRRQSEESEARYRFLANSIPVHVWTATPDGSLDYVSDLTAASLGKTPAQIVGEGWLEVLHPDDVAPTIERWTRSLKTGEPYEVEFRLWDADQKTYRWYLGRARAQRDGNGKILRWFGSNTDIEESKRTQEDLRRLTDEALEANRAKSDFLAAMSHDLRTPLNAIGGYAQLLEMGVRGPITDAQKADLERIQRSKNHLDRLVSDVLSFAKLGAGRIELRCEPIRMKHLLGSVVDMIRPQLAEKKLNLTPLSVDPELRIKADLDKTQQILINLLANALKFTPAGGTISILAQARETRVAISVIDTGIGIPEDQLERIFQPFAQAKSPLVVTDAGVGLGLAIGRQLARAMDGELTVTSTVGEGSNFTLTLPRALPASE
ncbi:MAG TPA: ATP-binding protein [Gemmatimonadaceae bacterium]|nr:ATP-binding protein [Gemmatimonadaceae bacterium]